MRWKHSLSYVCACSVCLQCAHTAGVDDIASKASAVLWKHFVHPSQPSTTESQTVNQEDGREEEHLKLHPLNKPLLSTTPTAILRHFVQSIIINVQLAKAQGSLFSNQLCTNSPLKPSQLLRLKLVSKLFTAMQVAGVINDASLCLQATILCLGLLSPLVQHSVTARPLLDALLYCHAVLTELPEHILISKDSASTASLHHIIAATAYHVGKVTM